MDTRAAQETRKPHVKVTIENCRGLTKRERNEFAKVLMLDAKAAFNQLTSRSAINPKQKSALLPGPNANGSRKIRLWRNEVTGKALGRHQYDTFPSQQKGITVTREFHQYPNPNNFFKTFVEVTAHRMIGSATKVEVMHQIGHGVIAKFPYGSVIVRHEQDGLAVYIDLRKGGEAEFSEATQILGMEVPRNGANKYPDFGEQLAKHILALVYYGRIPEDQSKIDGLTL